MCGIVGAVNLAPHVASRIGVAREALRHRGPDDVGLKGIFELLEAFSRLVRRNEATLIVPGTGHAERDAQDVVSKCGLRRLVKFAGGLQGQKLHQVIAESDVLVLPSWVEGFPNAVIEAMAAALAVVVTTVGAIQDVLTHEEHALRIPREM